ncbi:MAG: glutaredoxin family protein [Fervidicoccaceae archaeon]
MKSGKKSKLKLIVYGTEGCIPCERAVKYLSEMGIEWEYIDIEKNEEARMTVEMIEGGELLLPLILNPENEQIALGCPVEKEKFEREIGRIVSQDRW